MTQRVPSPIISTALFSATGSNATLGSSWLRLWLTCSLFLSLVLTQLSGCVLVPTGAERVARIDALVQQQEFQKVELLLATIDTHDPEYAALETRRRAMGPLIAQFEANTQRELLLLQKADRWPEAEVLLLQAQRKLPSSTVLSQATKRFYREREARLSAIGQQIALLKGQHLASVAPLVHEASDVHPTGLTNRWQQFWHQRKAKKLATELFDCGAYALQQNQLALAESCLTMALALGSKADVQGQLAVLQTRRAEIAAAAEQVAAKKRQARLAEEAVAVKRLKARYQQLFAAGWWNSARDTLAELAAYRPQDPVVSQWRKDLKQQIDREVAQSIRTGQALYSEGQLHQALAVWRKAATLDPDNGVLQGHIARVERFIEKLDRLDPKGPSDLESARAKVSQNLSFPELMFPRTYVSQNLSFPGLKFSQDLSSPGLMFSRT